MSRMLGFESGMAGETGRSRGYMLLLVMACISLTISDGPTCPMEILQNTTLDITPAVTKGARGEDPVYMDTEESCVEKCCASKSTSGVWNCTLVIFDSRKTGNHPNCYLFHCPTDEACPTKPTTGVTSYRVIRDNGQVEESSSKSKDTKPTYVNVKKEKSMSLDSKPSDAKKTKEHVSEDSNMVQSITSKILGMRENIEKPLDKMDHSLEEEQEKPEEKKSIQKPDRKPLETAENGAPQPIGSQVIEPEVSIKITTTTQATTSTTTPPPTTTLHTTTRLPTTTALPTTTLLVTTTLIPTTTTTTTTTLPTTSTMTTTRPTTTSTVTTMLSTTTSTTAMLVTTPVETTFTTTPSTTTSVANHITTTSTTTTDTTTTKALPTTPAVTAAEPAHSNPKHVNNNINAATPSKVGPLTATPKPAISSPHAKPTTALPKLQTITKATASRTPASSDTMPRVVVEDSASLQNVNKDLHGAESKILETINSDSQSGDRSGLVAALVFGVSFFVVVLFLVSRRALEAMRRRHYSRLDYLINGMYIDT